MAPHPTQHDGPVNRDVDVLGVGAGFAGLYLLYRLRRLGFSTVVLESADDVGGTWYWNRYPGARCDIESLDYSYSFDPELEKEWQWSERYATQPEILRYLGHVADKYALRPDIRFGTAVASAVWDAAARRWRVRTDQGDEIRCRFYVMATGCLSHPKTPDIPGVDRLAGEVYFTSRWPHAGVDFTGKRVAVIGTGSSGIQSIPLIAEQAAELTVFQRTPNFTRPAHNGPVTSGKKAALERDPAAYREAARWSRAGVPIEQSLIRTFQVSSEERLAAYEAGYASGDLLAYANAFVDPSRIPRPTRRCANSSAARSGRSCATPRPRRRFPRGTTSTAPSDPASTPTTSRPSTGPTSASSTCAGIPSGRSQRAVSIRRRDRSRLTRSCSPRGSTP